MNENEIAQIILDKAFEIHRNLGPGLLESVGKFTSLCDGKILDKLVTVGHAFSIILF
jgi:hypothetical protein